MIVRQFQPACSSGAQIHGITTPPVLPAANLSLAYQVTLESAGGAGPYIWSVSAGSLPPGLTFHADGKIDGTPTTAGSFNFTALVVDGNSSRATKDLTLPAKKLLGSNKISTKGERRATRYFPR